MKIQEWYILEGFVREGCKGTLLNALYVLSSSDRKDQGIKSERNCRLSTETPGYQLGWAVLAASRLLDILK